MVGAEQRIQNTMNGSSANLTEKNILMFASRGWTADRFILAARRP